MTDELVRRVTHLVREMGQGPIAGRVSEHELRRALADSLHEIERLKNLLSRPQLFPFIEAVRCEMVHQQLRFPPGHDQIKTSADWIWLLAHLATKGAAASTYGDLDKALHHTISTAAACGHWHGCLAEKRRTS